LLCIVRPSLSLSLSSNSTIVNGDVLTQVRQVSLSLAAIGGGGGAPASTCVYMGVGSCFPLMRPVFFSHSKQALWFCGGGGQSCSQRSQLFTALHSSSQLSPSDFGSHAIVGGVGVVRHSSPFLSK
jgi:hypothetical protein